MAHMPMGPWVVSDAVAREVMTSVASGCGKPRLAARVSSDRFGQQSDSSYISSQELSIHHDRRYRATQEREICTERSCYPKSTQRRPHRPWTSREMWWYAPQRAIHGVMKWLISWPGTNDGYPTLVAIKVGSLFLVQLGSILTKLSGRCVWCQWQGIVCTWQGLSRSVHTHHYTHVSCFADIVYLVFAGKEPNRALGLSSLKPEDCISDYSQLSEKETQVLNDWHTFFSKRYNIVGRLQTEGTSNLWQDLSPFVFITAHYCQVTGDRSPIHRLCFSLILFTPLKPPIKQVITFAVVRRPEIHQPNQYEVYYGITLTGSDFVHGYQSDFSHQNPSHSIRSYQIMGNLYV